MYVLPRRGGGRHRRHLLLHALRAQHGAGRRAARSSPWSGSSASSLTLGGGSTRSRSSCRSWCSRSACSHGAQKMNGIMQDVGRGTHKLGRGALHLPPPVPRRPDGAAGRCGGLRGADGDRHPGDPRAGADRQPGRRGADLHQPDPAAGAAVVRRRQPAAAAAQPGARPGGRPGPQGSARLWLLLDRFTERRWAAAAIVVAVRAWRRRASSVSLHAEGRRPGRRRARAAARLALQPRQRLHHRATTASPATSSR